AGAGRAGRRTGGPGGGQAWKRRSGSSPEPARMPSLAAIDALWTTEATLRLRTDERHDVAYSLHVGELPRYLVDALRQRARFSEQHLIGGAKRLDLLAREAAALQAHDVEAHQPRAVADHLAIRDHVALDAGDAADHRVFADTHELMHGRQSAEDGEIADRHVARKRCIVGHDDVVADPAIVCDMGAHHEETAVADPRQHAAAGGAGIHRDVLAHGIAPADLQAGSLTLIFQVLRLMAD